MSRVKDAVEEVLAEKQEKKSQAFKEVAEFVGATVLVMAGAALVIFITFCLKGGYDYATRKPVPPVTERVEYRTLTDNYIFTTVKDYQKYQHALPSNVICGYEFDGVRCQVTTQNNLNDVVITTGTNGTFK